MESKKQNVAVGLTGMTALAGLLAMLILFGHIPGWGETAGYPVIVHIKNAKGLHVGSRVLLNGIVVGDIKKVKFRKDPSKGVEIVTQIKEGIKIPADVNATLSSSLFGGSSTLSFVLPTINKKKQKENRLCHSPITYLPVSGKPAVIEGKSQSLIVKLSKLSDTWKEFGQNINKLVEPRTIAQVDSGDKVGNMSTVLDRLDKRLKSLKDIMASVQNIVGDKQFAGNVRQIASNINKLTINLNKEVDSISKAVKGNVNKLGKHYTQLADHMGKAVDSLQKLTNKVNSGNGTLNKLLNDPSLYDNLDDAVLQLKAAADQGKLLIEKWKAEGLPVHF